jgi:predicted porin
LGLNYATSQAGTAVKVKGTDLGAKYDLSKRTFIAAHYQKVSNKDNASELYVSGTSDAAATTNSNNKFRIQVAHSF